MMTISTTRLVTAGNRQKLTGNTTSNRLVTISNGLTVIPCLSVPRFHDREQTGMDVCLLLLHRHGN